MDFPLKNWRMNIHSYQRWRPWPCGGRTSLHAEFLGPFSLEKATGEGEVLGNYIVAGWWFGTWILFFHILGIIIPTDEHIFQRGLKPPTRYCGDMIIGYYGILHIHNLGIFWPFSRGCTTIFLKTILMGIFTNRASDFLGRASEYRRWAFSSFFHPFLGSFGPTMSWKVSPLGRDPQGDTDPSGLPSYVYNGFGLSESKKSNAIKLLGDGLGQRRRISVIPSGNLT